MDDQSHSTETAEQGRENQPAPARISAPRPPARKSAYVPKAPVAPRQRAPIDDGDDDGFFKRNLAPIIIGVIVLAGGGYFLTHMPSGKSTPAQHAPEQIVRITLPPPPPPPPPPKLQPPPPKDVKQPEHAPVDKPMDKPAEKPKPVDKPPEGLGTNIKGPGGNGDLSSSGNGTIGGTGNGPNGGGSMWGWYAGQVQARVADALRKNPRTSSATLNIQVKVWTDSTGRISRAQLVGSTGDKAMDDAIKNEVLTGLRMQEAPPADMPVPITLRLTARRPH